MLENPIMKKHYKADEIASTLGVKKFVIRTWEKQFELNRTEIQYNENDLLVFQTIRDLLYTEKLSLTDAKQKLTSVLLQKNQKQMQSVEAITITQADVQENRDVSQVEQAVDISEESKEIVAAVLDEVQTGQNQTEFQLSQNEKFWNNIKIFKEQLLRIQEQIK